MTSQRIMILALVAVSFCTVTAAQAQLRPQANVTLMGGIPVGDFKDHVDHIGFGLNGFGGVRFGRSPLVVGLDLGFLIYGTETRREPFSTTIPDVTVEVETNNNIFPAHLMMRLQPPSGVFRPYLDGLFGLKYFYTETSIRSVNFPSNADAIAASTNFDDTALSYGVGGGLDLEVYRGGGERGKIRNLSINLGVRYLFGSEAEYLKKGSIKRVNGQVTFDPERSRTDMILPQLGVTFGF